MFRHRFDPSSLVAALLFLGVAVRYLAVGLGWARLPSLWVTPMIVAGLVVMSILRLAFRRRRQDTSILRAKSH